MLSGILIHSLSFAISVRLRQLVSKIVKLAIKSILVAIDNDACIFLFSVVILSLWVVLPLEEINYQPKHRFQD